MCRQVTGFPVAVTDTAHALLSSVPASMEDDILGSPVPVEEKKEPELAWWFCLSFGKRASDLAHACNKLGVSPATVPILNCSRAICVCAFQKRSAPDQVRAA